MVPTPDQAKLHGTGEKLMQYWVLNGLRLARFKRPCRACFAEAREVYQANRLMDTLWSAEDQVECAKRLDAKVKSTSPS